MHAGQSPAHHFRRKRLERGTFEAAAGIKRQRKKSKRLNWPRKICRFQSIDNKTIEAKRNLLKPDSAHKI
jgi:hypothetical protein